MSVMDYALEKTERQAGSGGRKGEGEG